MKFTIILQFTAVICRANEKGKRCNASSYTMRNSQNYSLPKCCLQLYKTSFVPTVIGEWNTLPHEIRDAPSLITFSQK